MSPSKYTNKCGRIMKGINNSSFPVKLQITPPNNHENPNAMNQMEYADLDAFRTVVFLEISGVRRETGL